MTQVFHHVSGNFFADQQPDKWPHPDWKLVAELEGDENVAFELTNHIDHDWTTNPGLIVHSTRHRSTSVGDIVVVRPFNGGEKVLLCKAMGWEELHFEQEHWHEDFELESRKMEAAQQDPRYLST